MMKHMRWTLLLAGVMLLAACDSLGESFTLEDGSVVNNGISMINGRIDIGRDCQVDGDVSSVNGSIEIDAGTVVGGLRNVNGSIRLAENVQVNGGVENVNGGISLAAGNRVEGDVETVNGSVSAEGSVIDGRVVSVNGSIELSSSQVAGVQSHNGRIRLVSGTEVDGPLTMKRSRGFQLEVGDPPKVVIGENVRVTGPLQFEREVRLYVHDSAEIGEVEGAEVERFSGEEP